MSNDNLVRYVYDVDVSIERLSNIQPSTFGTDRSDRSWSRSSSSSWAVVQDLYSTDPTQESRARSCRLYCSHPATLNYIIRNREQIYYLSWKFCSRPWIGNRWSIGGVERVLAHHQHTKTRGCLGMEGKTRSTRYIESSIFRYSD